MIAELTMLREAVVELSERLQFPEPDDGFSNNQRYGAKNCLDAAWRYLGEAVAYLTDY